MVYDFCGWASRAGIKCADGRTIAKNAFKHNNGLTVPLVWNHGHDDAKNVLGHALLENREEGVYVHGKFNDTAEGIHAKRLVQNGDITALSIYANNLQHDSMRNVLHGNIREVSLVLAGANPGAYIEDVIEHSGLNTDSIIFGGYELDELEHSAKKENEGNKEEDVKMGDERTVQDVFDTLTEEQKTVVYALIGEALKEERGDDEEMKQNIFENDNEENSLDHSAFEAALTDAKRYGSLRDSVLAHGIEDIEYLFPEAHNVNQTPEFIKRDMGWVSKVINGTHHTPFSRIKSQFANITADEARAKGYIKGNLKKEEVFSLLKRTTTPQTIYKKQKIDRDDVIDITDFDVVAWLKAEMRMMLDEEIARAVLIGDGRLTSDDDKINEQNIRPIFNDADLYTIKAVTTAKNTDDPAAIAKDFIRTAIKSRKAYKGSGNLTLFCSDDILTECLLLEDSMGRMIYEDESKLAKTLRVNSIVPVPVMENAKGKNGGDLLAVIVDLDDYNIGADKGGAINMFDDFDIDYNQQKYLIETRCSGALTKPYSAIAIETAI